MKWYVPNVQTRNIYWAIQSSEVMMTDTSGCSRVGQIVPACVDLPESSEGTRLGISLEV